MKHKTEYTQDTLESSSQTSSGVTVRLSTADRSSPESPFFQNYTRVKTHQVLVSGPGRWPAVGGQRDYTPVHEDYFPTELPDEEG